MDGDELATSVGFVDAVMDGSSLRTMVGSEEIFLLGTDDGWSERVIVGFDDGEDENVMVGELVSDPDG